MKSFRFNLLLLLPFCLTLMTQAKMRGEREGSPFQKNRRLLDSVLSADALRHSLGTQRASFQATPFKDELSVPGLSGRKDARARQFRKMKSARDTVAPETATDTTTPMLDIVLAGKGGKSKGMMGTMSSKSKGKGGMSSTKSKGKSKGMKSTSSADKGLPTIAPTVHIPAPTQTPMLTDKPTCAPSTGVFPQDVSGFFQAPSGETSQLQKELDSALSEIQIPSEFERQCAER